MSPAPLTEEAVLQSLRSVMDPDLRRDVVSLGFVKNLKIRDGHVSLDLELTTPACPVKDQLKAEATERIRSLPGVKEVSVQLSAAVRGRPVQGSAPMLAGVKNLVAIASGKGGVGKSTASANLALALAATGARVGLLDADVYGPSLPTMFGICETPEQKDGRLVPLERHGVRLMSMGFLATRDTPVIWRGPMATKLIQQFLMAVDWGALDYLLIDLPPGTGDVQLTLVQTVPLTGAVIITTPQDVARSVAQRGLRMFQQTDVPILGIIENMSHFSCPHCGERTDIFRHGGGRQVSDELGLPFLGEIPLDPEMVVGGDEGTPLVAKNPKAPGAKAWRDVAGALAARISVVNLSTEATRARPASVAVESGHVVIRWEDGTESRHPFAQLRRECPCAVCVDENTGIRRHFAQALPPDFRPLEIQKVGRYALQFFWSDGHNTGIYTFNSLRDAAEARK